MDQASFAIKRAHTLFQCFVDAEVILHDGGLVPAQISELSSRGCYIDTLEPIPVGTALHLRICEGINACELRGKVIYTQSGGGMGIFGMGVLFGKMSAEQHSPIDAWLCKLASKHRKPPC
jgi:hypothetical protein